MILELGNTACKKAEVVKYIRLSDLLFVLDQARRNGKYKAKLRLYARSEILIIDEFLLNLTTHEQQGNILELSELRYDSHTTIIAPQFTPDRWHKILGGRSIAATILGSDYFMRHAPSIHRLSTINTHD